MTDLKHFLRLRQVLSSVGRATAEPFCQGKRLELVRIILQPVLVLFRIVSGPIRLRTATVSAIRDSPHIAKAKLNAVGTGAPVSGSVSA